MVKTPSSRDVFEEKTEDPHESVPSKIIPKRQRKDDPVLNLLLRLFDFM
jgi:hypothetical protein